MVKYATWDTNQWVSYDDDDTFDQKRDFANSRCLGGTMVGFPQLSPSPEYGSHLGILADIPFNRCGQWIRETRAGTMGLLLHQALLLANRRRLSR